jgi:hypothetical protein
MPPSLYKHALELHEKGWTVFPVRGNKRPNVDTWQKYQKEKPSKHELMKWFHANPTTKGIAVVCGSASNIVVVDIDSKSSTFREDIARLGELGVVVGLPNCVTTGGCGDQVGYHVYFKKPPGQVKNRVGVFGKPGVDIRADGGYVVAPPSKMDVEEHNGRSYAWCGDGVPEFIPEMPKPLADLLAGKESKEKIQLAKEVREGNRDHEMTRRVGVLVEKGLSYEDVFQIAISLNNQVFDPPMDRAQVVKIVDSVFSAESKKKNSRVQAPKTFELQTFEGMLGKYSEHEEEFIIEGWLPEKTCGLVISPPGSYKTWVVTALAISVASGHKFLGHFDVNTCGPVIVVQQEDNFSTLMARASQIMNVGEVATNDTSWVVPQPPKLPNIFWHTQRELRLDDQEMLDAFCDRIRTIRPVLVIIDPLYMMASMDDYMAKAAQQMKLFKQLRDEVGTSFIIVHHTGKSSSNDRKRDNAWGSQFINAWLETGWQLELDGESAVYVHRNFKNSGSPEKTRLRFDIGECSFKVGLGEDPSPLEETDTTMLKNALAGGTYSSLNDLSRDLGIPKSTVGKRVQSIGGYKDEYGFYRL